MRYRDIAWKLTALGCVETPRTGGGCIGSGPIRQLIVLRRFPIGVEKILSLGQYEPQFGNLDSSGRYSKGPDDEMSIYSTLLEFGIKRFGDNEFVRILVQGVPPHIDDTGSAWEFLPAPVNPEGTTLRAVFFVEPGDAKGTERCGQEHMKPLLMLMGSDYENIRFVDLMSKLEEALDRKYGKRPSAIYLAPDGTEKKIY